MNRKCLRCLIYIYDVLGSPEHGGQLSLRQYAINDERTIERYLLVTVLSAVSTARIKT